MKVALSFPGCHRRAGVERIVLECARYLSSRQHDVHVFANEWEAQQGSHIRYHYVPMRRRPYFLRGPSYHRQCTSLIRQHHFDVLNTHGCVCPTGGVHWVQSVQMAWLEQSRRFRAPMSAARWKQRLNPLHPLLLRLEREHFGKRNYRLVIATTDEVKSDLHRFYGVPAEDVVVIPNGFSPTEFNPERRAARREEMRRTVGLAKNDIALLFVANELQRKGYETILAAMKQLNDARLRVLVVGKPDPRLVRTEAVRHGVADQVIPCGRTSDIAAFHAAADIFVLPTQYEAFCLAILEALGSGLPVVTSRVPGAYNAILPSVNGFTIEDPNSGEELAHALEPLLCARMRTGLSANAPGSVQCYQWPNVLARYEEVLLDACDGASARRKVLGR